MSLLYSRESSEGWGSNRLQLNCHFRTYTLRNYWNLRHSLIYRPPNRRYTSFCLRKICLYLTIKNALVVLSESCKGISLLLYFTRCLSCHSFMPSNSALVVISFSFQNINILYPLFNHLSRRKLIYFRLGG